MDTWQTTNSMEPYIKKMLAENARLKTIFKFLRGHSLWSGIGDFPLMRVILLTAKDYRPLVKKEVTQLFRQSPEFKKLQSNHLNYSAFTHDLYEQKAPIKGINGRDIPSSSPTSSQARKDKNDRP